MIEKRRVAAALGTRLQHNQRWRVLGRRVEIRLAVHVAHLMVHLLLLLLQEQEMMRMMNGSVMRRVGAILERVTLKNLLVDVIVHLIRLGLAGVVVPIVVVVVRVILMHATGRRLSVGRNEREERNL